MASHLAKTTSPILEAWGRWKKAFAKAADGLGLPDIQAMVAIVGKSPKGCPQQENNRGQDEPTHLEVLDPAPIQEEDQCLGSFEQDVYYWAYTCSQVYLRNEARVAAYMAVASQARKLLGARSVARHRV